MKLWGIKERRKWWTMPQEVLKDGECLGPRGECLFWSKKKAINERDLSRIGIDFPGTIKVVLFATVERAKEGR